MRSFWPGQSPSGPSEWSAGSGWCRLIPGPPPAWRWRRRRSASSWEGGPFRLGIGASSGVIVEQWHGLPFIKPLARVRDTVLAVREALAGQGDYVGATLTMSRFRPATAPAGPVPIFVGALRPRMLALAGELGDGVCLNLMPPRVVIRQLAEVRRGAGAAGRDLPADFGVMARLQTVVTDDPAGVSEMLRELNSLAPTSPSPSTTGSWRGWDMRRRPGRSPPAGPPGIERRWRPRSTIG